MLAFLLGLLLLVMLLLLCRDAGVDVESVDMSALVSAIVRSQRCCDLDTTIGEIIIQT